jgi:hypothetical protein
MFLGRIVCSSNRYEACPRRKLCDHHHLWSVTVVMSFSSKIREVPWANNGLFWSSIKSSFQRIKNRQIWRSVWRVMVKSFNVARSEIPLDRLQRYNKTSITSLSGVQLGWMTTCWKDNLMHLAMKQKFGMCSTLDEGEFNEDRGSSNRRRRWWRSQRMIGRLCMQKMIIWSWPKLEATRLEEPLHHLSFLVGCSIYF